MTQDTATSSSETVKSPATETDTPTSATGVQP